MMIRATLGMQRSVTQAQRQKPGRTLTVTPQSLSLHMMPQLPTTMNLKCNQTISRNALIVLRVSHGQAAIQPQPDMPVFTANDGIVPIICFTRRLSIGVWECARVLFLRPDTQGL